MTLDELNNLLNLFNLSMSVDNDNVYLYNLEDNSMLDTYRILICGSKPEEIKTSNRNELLKGCVFEAIQGTIKYFITIRYDDYTDKYYFSNMRIEDNENEISKMVDIKSNDAYNRLEYYVEYNYGKYSYTLVLTKNLEKNWKEIYLDELDLNNFTSPNVYRVDGTPNNFEISNDKFDYEKICSLDPLIIKIINYFSPEIKSFLPKIKWDDYLGKQPKVLLPSNN